MIAWMAYAALVGAIVAAGGMAMEQLAAATGRPRRIAWLAALAVGLAIPLAGGWGDPVAVPVEEAAAPESEPAGGQSVAGDLWRAVPAMPVPRDRTAGRVALLAWGAGSLAAMAVLAGVLAVVARGRRRWERRRVLGADLYVSRRFGPALVGVARPRVVIPRWVTELEPGARNAIIRHELEHARAGDHLALLYGGLVAAAFPWSPAIWWMYRRLRAAVELDCDQRVLASGIGVADYGDVLLGAGARARGRWGFAPAMGQPRTLLERRLKTMSEKRRRLNAGRAALLVTAAAGSVALACGTPVPMEVREAFEEVRAEDAAQGADRVEVFLGAKAFGMGPEPILFVDGVRVRAETDLPESASDWFGGSIPDPDDIERVKMLRGPAATKLYGEEAAGGVIEIFTKDADYASREAATATARAQEEAARTYAEAARAHASGDGTSDMPFWAPRDVDPNFRDERSMYALAVCLEEHYPLSLRDAGIGGKVVVWAYVDETGDVVKTQLSKSSGRDAGIGGKVVVWAYVNETGDVVKTQLSKSSGHAGMDEVALREVRDCPGAEFSPGMVGDRPVALWVAVPITFSPR